MGQTVSSLYRRIAFGLVASVALFIAGVILLPDAVPLVPAIVVPIWVALFSTNREYDAQSRRVLTLALAAGVALFLVGVVVLLFVD